MGAIKDLITEAAFKMEKEQHFISFEGAMDNIMNSANDMKDIINYLYGAKEVRDLIRIKCVNRDEEFYVANKIHDSLRGKEDYIDCKIVLNMSDDRTDGTDNEVHVYVFNDASSDVTINKIMERAFGYNWNTSELFTKTAFYPNPEGKRYVYFYAYRGGILNED